MKTAKCFLLSLLILASPTVFADDHSMLSGETMNYIGYGAIIFSMLLLLVVVLVLLHTFKVMAKIILGPEGYKQALEEEKAAKLANKKPKVNVVEKLLSLKPLSEEKSILMEHEYDGIQELDNPTPDWFMVLFYATIIFAVGYILIYHVFGIGQLQYEEYRTEMSIAAKEKNVWLAKAANRVDENTVKLTTEPAVLLSGQAIFKQTCAPCHGDHAQGNVGPNLTDDYWLHGNKINDLFKTIKYGVPGKGMPTWEKQLSPKQIADVANYIKSIHGSNPANPKAPQGDKIVDEAATQSPKTAMIVKGK